MLQTLLSYKCELFIELTRYPNSCHHSQLQHLQSARQNQSLQQHEAEEALLDLAHKYNIPLVAANPISFLQPSMHEACDALSCIIHSRYVLEEDRPKINTNHYFKTQKEMEELFADLPEAIENTALIARKCSFMPESSAPLLPRFSIDTDEETSLKDQANFGLALRLANMPKSQQQDYWKRLDFELTTINRMGFPGYFLIVSDFIRWSKKNDIPVGPGRGSGAGSVVAWALEITDLDPLQFGLLFERFLNPERVSLPDFDIDFCQSRRDEVIQYVRQRYGFDKVAHIITFGKLQARAVLRDVGRVLQMSYGLVDKICKMVPNNPAHPITLREAIDIDKEMQRMRDEEPDVSKLLEISLQLEGVHRHVSTHAAGVIIADRPIVELVALYQTPDIPVPIAQYSMKYAEAAGLMKFDFLGLKTLTVISETCKLIAKHRTSSSYKEKNIDISKIPFNDKKTFDLLAKGQTIGVFQFEGSGMREAIKNLKPDHINDLIALTSLYRPGPIDNIPLYISRKHGLEPVEDIHPSLRETLAETYGIIVYQEQVMQIAQVLAGYSLGEADLLRRAMGKKNKQEMDAQREIFVQRAMTNGLHEEQAVNIFDLVDKFASYGFNKSHAAAYSVISYQTAYLKANHPIEFLIASINFEINDSDKISLFCREAKDMGIEVLPPCIQKSEIYFAIEATNDGQLPKRPKEAIRFGLAGLKNAGTKVLENMANERKAKGAYANIFDFIKRTNSLGMNKRLLESLAKSGAFSAIHPNAAQILAEVEAILHHESHNDEAIKQFNLFDFGSKTDGSLGSSSQENILNLRDIVPFNFKQQITAEYQALGFYLQHHPLEPYAKRLQKLDVVSSNQIEHYGSKEGVNIKVAGVIASRKIRSSKGGKNSKYAFMQISDMDGMIDTSIFNDDIIYKQPDLLEVGTLVLCNLQIRRDGGGMRSTIERIENLEIVMQHIKSKYEVVISDIKALEYLINIIRGQQGLNQDHRKQEEQHGQGADQPPLPDISNSCAINLILRLPSQKSIVLSTAQKLYLPYDDMTKLNQKDGIEINEIEG